MRHNNTYEGIYSYKDVLALPTRGAEIGCWKAVAETATDAATMIAVDFMVFSSKVFIARMSKRVLFFGSKEEDCVRADFVSL